MQVNQRPHLRGLNSPYRVRANLRAREQIIAQMADDLRVLETRRGYVDADDMELLGWTPAQLNTCGADARRRALKHSVRNAA